MGGWARFECRMKLVKKLRRVGAEKQGCEGK